MALATAPQIGGLDLGAIELDSAEWKLLELLQKNTGRIVTHIDIANHVWPTIHNRSNPWTLMQAIYVTVAGLRRKIEIDPARPQYLANIKGVGYVLYAEPPSKHDGVNYADRTVSANKKRREIQTAKTPLPIGASRGRLMLGPSHPDYPG